MILTPSLPFCSKIGPLSFFSVYVSLRAFSCLCVRVSLGIYLSVVCTYFCRARARRYVTYVFSNASRVPSALRNRVTAWMRFRSTNEAADNQVHSKILCIVLCLSQLASGYQNW